MKSGQLLADIWQVAFSPAGIGTSARLPVELFSFAEFRAMDVVGRRRRPQRPSFHVLAIIEEGHGAHRSDFADRQLQPQTVVHLRPGVVHQWTDVDQIDGLLVLFTPRATGVDLETANAPSITRHLDLEEWALLRAAAAHLQVEYADTLRLAASEAPAVLKHTLSALVLRADNDPAVEPATSEHVIFRVYRTAVEEHFWHWRHVNDYASVMGYSSRTISRATLSAAGVTAKQFLDERITLEAKRLLAHTDITVSELAGALGFTQAANFITFFTAHTGRAPSPWRASERQTVGSDNHS